MVGVQQLMGGCSKLTQASDMFANRDRKGSLTQLKGNGYETVARAVAQSNKNSNFGRNGITSLSPKAALSERAATSNGKRKNSNSGSNF
jgi:hypothetical protein